MLQIIFDELVKEVESYKDLDEKYLVSKINDNGFEKKKKKKISPMFNSKIKEILPNHDIKLVPQFGHHFPDMDLNIDNSIYGIELKSRKDGSWQTQGGSAFESTSNNSYKEIYLLFASRDANKGETSYQVRYAPYWQAAEAIKVTHSPRFSINLDAQSSVFASNEDYNRFHKLTKEEKSKFIQKALAKSITKPTWYSNPNDIVTATLYSELGKEQKNKLVVEALILFPNDLLHQDNDKPHANYGRVAKYLLDKYYVVNTSTRDMFTAGGQYEFRHIKLPKMIKTYQSNQNQIIQTLQSNKSFSKVVYDYWDWPNDSSKTTPLNDFKLLLNKLGNKYLKQQLSALNSTLSEIIFNDFE